MSQIKDRHNGNILLDDEGHLVHIDFGFMLCTSPGGVNFEAAPFKLTRELLEVMESNSEGSASELFDYFKVRRLRVAANALCYSAHSLHAITHSTRSLAAVSGCRSRLVSSGACQL
jgi:hypothetical protein